MRILYLDLQAGAAGDMLLGALLDAGADEASVRSTLDQLAIPGWSLEVDRVQRGGVEATKVRVLTEGSHDHRNLATIRHLLSALPQPVRDPATRAFLLLAEAEAEVHGTTIDEVHFHEVGAVDAIVDIVGTCAALRSLAVDRVVASPLPLGSGHVEAAHGILPVPAPATSRLIQKQNIPVIAGGEGEAVTPTGAVLVAVMVDSYEHLPPMQIEAVGYGAGDRNTEKPNVVRAFVGLPHETKSETDHLLVETNIDDMAPELLPYAIEALIRAGADDAWVTPIQMKKRRPAFLLSMLVHRSRRSEVMDALFRETTTMGCRIVAVEKEELERSWVEVQIDDHGVRVKVARRGGAISTIAPEYEDAAKVARATGRPLKDIYAEALRLASEAQERSR